MSGEGREEPFFMCDEKNGSAEKIKNRSEYLGRWGDMTMLELRAT